jgi:hypothetical protein
MISGRECARALNQGNLRLADPREIVLGLHDLASAFEGDWIIGIAGDFMGALLELWRRWGATADTQAQAMAVGVATRPAFTR